MNKKEATKNLAKIIKESQGQEFVTNTAYQKHLLETALYLTPCDTNNNVFHNLSTSSTDYESLYMSSNRPKQITESAKNTHQAQLKEFCEKSESSNYVFLETVVNITQGGTDERISVTAQYTSNITFFAMIGDKEIDTLRDILKGDMNETTLEAAKTLGIEERLKVNYADLAENDPSTFCQYFIELTDDKKIKILENNWEFLSSKNQDNQIKELIYDKKYKNLIVAAGRDKITNE